MKKSNLFAPFLMLLAGTVASITMRYFRYTTAQMLPRLLLVLIVFYFAGCFIQKKVHKFVDEILKKEAEEKAKEGEVIEKEVPEEDREEAAKEAEEQEQTSERNISEENG